MTTATAPTTPTFLNYFKTAMGLTVFFSGQDPISVAKQNALYSSLEEKLRTGDFKDLYQLANLAARVKAHSKGKFLLVEKDGKDVVLLHNQPMPPALSEFTLKFVEQGFNTDFIERFWKNLCQNPSEDSRQDLYGFIESNNMTLTDDGCFIGYRAIRSDWKDLYTGTIDNSIGQTPKMNRDEVDADRNRTCSRGLHVAAWSYAKDCYGAWNRGEIYIEVKVNPRDVVTVPTDYNQRKMRVCEYTVIGQIDAPRDTLVHPDTFADDLTAWDAPDDAPLDATEATTADPEVFVMAVTTNGGVNIPKELAIKAGFKVGDTAYACYDTNDDVVKVTKNCCNTGDVCGTRTVDAHNSIRLGSGVFKAWDVSQGDDIQGSVVTKADGTKYIQLV